MDIPDDAYKLLPYEEKLKYLKRNRLKMLFSNGKIMVNEHKIHSISPVKKKYRAIGKMYLYAIMDLSETKTLIFSKTIIEKTLENKEEYLRRVLYFMKHHESHLKYADNPEEWLEKIEQLVREYKWFDTGVALIMQYYENNLLETRYRMSQYHRPRKTLVYKLTPFGEDVKTMVDAGYVF